MIFRKLKSNTLCIRQEKRKIETRENSEESLSMARECTVKKKKIGLAIFFVRMQHNVAGYHH